MANGSQKLGKVRSRPGKTGERWIIDFGRRWAPRFLYSFRGARFVSREMAESMLNYVEMEFAKGRQLDDVISELAPQTAAGGEIESFADRWIQLFERKVSAGDRQPRTLRDYSRWTKKDGSGNYIAWWFDKTIWDIDKTTVEEWSYWIAEHGVSNKTRTNVIAGFRALCTFIDEQRRDFEIPKFPWPSKEPHLPSVLTREVQGQVLSAIPYAKRGIFLCLADLLVRPSEARVLRLRDWSGEEIRVERGAKDRLVGGVVRGVKRSGGEKTLPVSLRLAGWFEAHVRAERRVSDPDSSLFWNPDAHDAGWWSETALRRTWSTACKKVGVQVSLYEGTKHSTATHLKGLGADDRLLASIMGHTDIRSVEKYARVQGRTIRNALAKLDPDT